MQRIWHHKCHFALAAHYVKTPSKISRLPGTVCVFVHVCVLLYQNVSTSLYVLVRLCLYLCQCERACSGAEDIHYMCERVDFVFVLLQYILYVLADKPLLAHSNVLFVIHWIVLQCTVVCCIVIHVPYSRHADETLRQAWHLVLMALMDCC